MATRDLFKVNSGPNFFENGSKKFGRLQKASHKFSLNLPIYKGCSQTVQIQIRFLRDVLQKKIKLQFGYYGVLLCFGALLDFFGSFEQFWDVLGHFGTFF